MKGKIKQSDTRHDTNVQKLALQMAKISIFSFQIEYVGKFNRVYQTFFTNKKKSMDNKIKKSFINFFGNKNLLYLGNTVMT